MEALLANVPLLNELDLPLLLLYAETHYRFFPHFPSLLFKQEPEILFDLPHRLEPGEDLPVVLIINDLIRFPDLPHNVSVTVSQPGAGTELFTFTEILKFEITHEFQKNQRVFLLYIPEKRIPSGEFFINASVAMSNSKKSYSVLNDNFNTSSKRAFRCYKSPTCLPGKGLCSYGDLHVHSQYSQSHVEFGPPISVIDIMAKSCGLAFVGITDHSYDLSCTIKDYLKEDQSLIRWKRSKEQLSDPSEFSTLFLLGEEVSCLNNVGKTVHLGALNIKEFIAGSSDGARRNLFYKQSLTIKQAVEEIHRQGGVAFAAHPGSRSGLLQRIFLNRGQWNGDDLLPDLDGFQALNSGFSASWARGKSLWIKMLRKKIHVPLLAGNDAHGDFNRYRAIKTPFLSIYENFQRYMGYGKTGIYGVCSKEHDILQGIKNAATFITTGPYLSINYSEDAKDFAVGKTVSTSNDHKRYIHAASTSEYGALTRLSVFANHGPTGEKLVYRTDFTNTTYENVCPVDLTHINSGSYIRAEVSSRCENGTVHQAFTSASLV